MDTEATVFVIDAMMPATLSPMFPIEETDALFEDPVIVTFPKAMPIIPAAVSPFTVLPAAVWQFSIVTFPVAIPTRSPKPVSSASGASSVLERFPETVRLLISAPSPMKLKNPYPPLLSGVTEMFRPETVDPFPLKIPLNGVSAEPIPAQFYVSSPPSTISLPSRMMYSPAKSLPS